MNQQGITDPTLLSNPRMIVPQQSELIYELYIQAKNAIAEDMLIWLDSVLIKEMLSYEGFRSGKLFTLINDDSKSHTRKYTYYSVQFVVDSVDLVNNYLNNYGDKFRLDAAAKYGKQFTEERRILSFQKFYTYDITFNPNTNMLMNISGNTSLTTEPYPNPQFAPASVNKKGIMSNIRNFFSLNRRREANLLYDNSKVDILKPNPLLAKNVSEQPIIVQSFGQVQPDTNSANIDKNLFFEDDIKNLDRSSERENRDENNLRENNINLKDNDKLIVVETRDIIDPSFLPSSDLSDDPNLSVLHNYNKNIINEVNNANQNLFVNRGINLISNQNPEDLTFSNSAPIGSKEESRFINDFQSKNIISDQPLEITRGVNKENLGTFANNPVTELTADVNKDSTFGSNYGRKLGDRDINYTKDQAFDNDFIDSVKSNEKDFTRKDIDRNVNFDYNRNIFNKENFIVEHNTEVKDLNDNQKYVSGNDYFGAIDKENLESIDRDFKKDIFASPSERDYTVAYDYEEKENDVNLANRTLGKENDYLDKDINKYSSEKHRSVHETRKVRDDNL